MYTFCQFVGSTQNSNNKIVETEGKSTPPPDIYMTPQFPILE